MSEAGVTRNVSMLRVFSLGMILVAMAGWGSFAYAAKTTAASHQQLQKQVAELKITQSQLITERDQARAEMADLKAGRDQLMAERDEAKAQLAAAREEVEALSKRLADLQAKASQTGTVSGPTPTQTKKPRR